jgi:hypothetical protein
MKMTAYPSLRKYSAEVAPRVPVVRGEGGGGRDAPALKLSRKRTVLDSRGTVVPPDCG